MKVYVPLTSNQGPFASVPVLPDTLRQVSKAWLIRWLEWLKAGKPEVDGFRANSGLAIRCNEFIPALHPRDPETGKFVERPFDIPDGVDSEAFAEMDTPELLQEIDTAGGDIEGLLQRDDVTIDGVPIDVDRLDDITNGGPDVDVTQVREQAEEIANRRDIDFSKRQDLAQLLEDKTGISARFDRFPPEQAAEIVPAVAKLADSGSTNDIVKVTSLSGKGKNIVDGDREPVGFHNASRQTVELNPDFLDSETLEDFESQNHLAGDDIEHIVFHEFGHAVHKQQDDRGEASGYFDRRELTEDESERIEAEISNYATENTAEFVAEAFAVRQAGGELSPQLSNLFTELMGER